MREKKMWINTTTTIVDGCFFKEWFRCSDVLVKVNRRVSSYTTFSNHKDQKKPL